MNIPSTQASLKEKLEANLQQKAEVREELIKTELEKLTVYLQKEIWSVKDTINQDLQVIKLSIRQTWLKPLFIGISVSLGISIGTYGMMQYLSNEIKNLNEQKKELADFNTEGMAIYSSEKHGIWVTIPKGMQLKNNGEGIGGQPAYNLVEE